MIQLLVKKGVFLTNNNYYINLYDEINIVKPILGTLYKPLQILTSQSTGNSRAFTGSIVEQDRERYIRLACVTSTYAGFNQPDAGNIQVGTKDYPLGLYDITMYENTENGNLDPTGLKIIYSGLANLSDIDGADGTTYSEYTTNDSDTDSVYITF